MFIVVSTLCLLYVPKMAKIVHERVSRRAAITAMSDNNTTGMPEKTTPDATASPAQRSKASFGKHQGATTELAQRELASTMSGSSRITPQQDVRSMNSIRLARSSATSPSPLPHSPVAVLNSRQPSGLYQPQPQWPNQAVPLRDENRAIMIHEDHESSEPVHELPAPNVAADSPGPVIGSDARRVNSGVPSVATPSMPNYISQAPDNAEQQGY